MALFQSTEELVACLGALYDEARRDPRIAPRLRDARLVVRFRYEQPAAVVTIDTTRPSADEGAYFDVLWGEQSTIQPEIEMSMQADIAHRFWLGKINLLAALSRRQIIARGPIPRILKLLPIVTPMYEMYPRVLQRLGRADLLLN